MKTALRRMPTKRVVLQACQSPIKVLRGMLLRSGVYVHEIRSSWHVRHCTSPKAMVNTLDFLLDAVDDVLAQRVSVMVPETNPGLNSQQIQAAMNE